MKITIGANEKRPGNEVRRKKNGSLRLVTRAAEDLWILPVDEAESGGKNHY